MDNKTLRELAAKAKITIDTFGSPILDNLHQLNLFAEVIVRECIATLGTEVQNKLYTKFDMKPPVQQPTYIPKW
jgi:hypothetical protein